MAVVRKNNIHWHIIFIDLDDCKALGSTVFWSTQLSFSHSDFQ
jgi:hypothetical protein